ncbi:hypothetical protein CEP51_008300 [Fusarium floridanum]|uniref:Uncharacterized protein n=1 Tax=Fusarium floridanum TaxID=1325733 RepID=A0A428RLC2_9HYPO|nr:hypothetical protein CEP51_008300 [Fusarium floridanum]
MIKYIANLDKKDPQTGLTVVISSYTTLSSRFHAKQERPFVFKPEHVPPSVQKRRKSKKPEAPRVNDSDLGLGLGCRIS